MRPARGQQEKVSGWPCHLQGLVPPCQALDSGVTASPSPQGVWRQTPTDNHTRRARITVDLRAAQAAAACERGPGLGGPPGRWEPVGPSCRNHGKVSTPLLLWQRRRTQGRGACCSRDRETGAADQALQGRRLPGAGRRSSQGRQRRGAGGAGHVLLLRRTWQFEVFKGGAS